MEPTRSLPVDRSRGRLLYRVEQIFLVHRATHRLLLHVADPNCVNDDVTLLPRVTALARDYFFVGEESAFEEFPLGQSNAWIALRPRAYLVAIVRGEPPNDLREIVQETLAMIHSSFTFALENFAGDPSPFLPAGPALASCLRSAYEPAKAAPRLRFRFPALPRIRIPRRMRFPIRLRMPRRVPWRIIVATAGLFVIGWVVNSRAERHWDNFVARLGAEPGLLVMTAERHIFGESRVRGLRDPLAKDPAALAREAKINPARIDFAWAEYTASDPSLVQRRFVQRFGAPPGAEVSINDGLVSIGGRVPNEWLERVRREATDVPGVTGIVERDLTVTFDPGRALEQFRAQFAPPSTVHAVVANNTLVLAGSASLDWITKVRDGATQIPGISAINGDALTIEFSPDDVLQKLSEEFGMPEGVKASFRNGALILTGEAPHQWLDSVRRGATRVPGVRILDDRKVEDIDQREFREAEATIDAATVLFVLNRDTLPPDPNGTLARVLEETKRCFAAAARMNVNVKLEVRGYGDATDSDTVNAGLSKRRADAVRAALINAGVDGKRIDSLGMGTPPRPGPGEKPGAGQYDRRVFFRIVIQP